MDSKSQTVTLKACLNVLEAAPPKNSHETASVMKEFLKSQPDALNEFSQNILSFPLETYQESDGRCFVTCEFNRLGDSYRSPFSNNVYPPIDTDEQVLSRPTRNLESQINEVWDAYRQHYYGKNAVGSVYLKEVEGLSFLACFLIHQDISEDRRLNKGVWNSSHIVRVGLTTKGSARYSIQSTVWISMTPSNPTNLSARAMKETDESHSVVHGNASHLETVGKMIEKIEIDMRANLEHVGLPKTHDIVEAVRRERKTRHGVPIGTPAQKAEAGSHASALSQAVLQQSKKK